MELLKRIGFTLRMLHRYRQALARIYRQTPKNNTAYQQSPQSLKQRGIEVVVLDFDGVLAADHALLPTPVMQQWLHDCLMVFGQKHIFLLSNKPLPTRIVYFEQLGIHCITGVKKKPYPDGLQQVMELTQQPAHHLLLLDDRLLTGVLATCIAGTQVSYITQPYIDWHHRPLAESIFMLLRFIERRIVQLYSLIFV
jgi:hypothetical protein